MGAIEDLNWAISNLQNQYESKKEHNRQIQAKIDALENAKRIMSDALDKADALRDSVGKQKVDGWWNGQLANEVTSHIETGRNQANGISQGIRDGIGEIDGHIWKLRMEYDYIVGLLNGIEDSINAKARERQRVINESSAQQRG